MIRHYSQATVAVFVVVALLAPLAGAGVAAAQEATPTPPNGANVTGGDSALPTERPTYVGEVDPTLQIRSYDYSGGTMTVEVEAKVPTRVVLSSWSTAQSGGEGVTTVPQRRQNLPKGVSTLEIEAESHRNYATVSVATNRGAVLISEKTGSTWFDGSPKWDYVIGAGAVSAVIGGGAPAVIALRKRRSESGSVRRLR